MFAKITLPVLLLSLATLTLHAQGRSSGGDQGAVTGDSIRRSQATLPPWNFMSLSTGGVDSFLLRHPTYDGRGVVVLIFDTGVDPSIPGLERTSTGRPKVIDVQDFARSNVVRFVPATVEGSGDAAALTAVGVPARLRGFSGLSPQPVDGTWYVGYIDEWPYRNSTVRDFDGDGGSETKFGALLYRAADGWRVVVDANADSALAGETPIGSYRERRETFRFAMKIPDQRSPLTLAANIDTAAKEVSFHYDMNVHGTHVAGIVAGFGINGEPGFNGIAPGAQIVSGKFSADTADDITITGSMRRAYEYAARLADSLEKEHTPVVVNMSFGIGSAIEGRADIESFIDDLLAKHPNLYVVTSAGNEGPGLSTVGVPAAASRVITVGAMLPRGIGADSYGATMPQDIIWDFSSRGGEVDKPDVVAPGTAVSTIPRFSYESRLSGTSMASPYTTGVVAMLLSALKQEDSTWVPTQALMRRALRNSARRLPYYSSIEQGGGAIDVARAYELLRRYRRTGFAKDLQEYTISTYSPHYPDQRGTTAFWRSTFVPSGDWRQNFTISRARSRDERTSDFFRAFTLEPTAPWLRTVQKTVYIRNEGTAQVDVLYDREKMKEPGLYSARIVARRASARGAAATEDVEFELINTVIVPYTFSAESGYTATTPGQRLEAGLTRRFYFAPPKGAASMTFTLSVPKGSRSNVSGWIIDRSGYNAGYLPRIKAPERYEGSSTVETRTLGEGVIEVIVQADAFEGTGSASEFTLTVGCTMLDVQPTVERRDDVAMLKVKAVATGNEILSGSFSYSIKGYGRVVPDTMLADTFSMPIVMRKTDGALWISPTFTPEVYNRSTDIIARLVDTAGNVQAQETYSKPSEWIFLPNFDREADSTVYYLQLIFGAANYAKWRPVPVEIVEHHVYPNEPRQLDGYSGTELVPYVPETLSTVLPAITMPAGYHGLGEVIFKPRGNDNKIVWEFTVPGGPQSSPNLVQ